MHIKCIRVRIVAAVLCAVVAVLCAPGAFGANVVQMSVETMADHAGQVIVGEVVSVRSYWAENPKRIESEVQLSGISYLKGALPDSGDTFTLVVPGGRVDEWEVHLCCAPRLRVGQRWILFLLPTYKTFPVVGFYQGAFRIERGPNGIERVYDAAGGSVLGVDSDGVVLSTRESKASAREHVTESEYVRFSPLTAAAADSLTYKAFRAQIQSVLDTSKSYALSEPAGRPVIVPIQAVPLRRFDDAGEGTVKAIAPSFVRSGTPREADAATRSKEVQP